MSEVMAEWVVAIDRVGDAYTMRDVTRCRDCRHFERGGRGADAMCTRVVSTPVPIGDSGGFCAWGSKRGER